MSLSANVQSRYSAQILINLTNPQDANALVLDATRLAAACTDVEADFQVHAGVVYDDTDARHVSVGVEGVIIKLMLRTAQTAQRDSLLADWKAMLRDLALVTGRNRILPTAGTSVGTGKGEFDEARFKDYVPEHPGAIGDREGLQWPLE